MFERFTADARMTVVEAQNVARASGSASVEPEHLLAGLAKLGHGDGGRLLVRLGVSPEDVHAEIERTRRRGGMSDADVEALGEFGIDVDQIVERIEEAHGPGALSGTVASKRGRLPFTGPTKKVLELTLRQALALGDKHIGQEHILLALMLQRGPAAELLNRAGVDFATVRALVQQRKAG